ncbi:RDD family protein [Spiroplasma endosymbiont of Othius punctulatus]|uniref:RDD family protein n=1 Tax=Spiroplasma endosymbiont of Othius punctulatus TaxID=3066289 RepID=UPI0030CAFE0F
MSDYSNAVPPFLMGKKLVKPFWGRLLAIRFLDLFLVSALQILVPLCFWAMDESISKTAIIFSIQIFLVLTYFVFIPTLLKGRTLFKLLINVIVLKEDGTKVEFWKILVRELIFIIIPTCLFFGSQVISAEVVWQTKSLSWAWIARVGLIVFFVWGLYTMVTIYVQADNLAWIDIKLGIRVYRIETPAKGKNIDTDFEAVKDMPLVFNEEDLQLDDKEDKDE